MPVSSNVTLDERSRRAGDLCCKGDFAGAIAALGDWWPGLGVHPQRNGLDDQAYAALLMVCGVISIEVGAISLRPAQNAAKNMLSQSARLFGVHPHAQAARLWLGRAYLRCGENHEAVALAHALLEENTNVDVVCGATQTKAVAEMQLGDAAKSLSTLDEIDSLVKATPVLVQGKYYLNCGIALRHLGQLDRALDAYVLASDLFLEADCPRYEAAVSNNVASIHMDRAEYAKAHVAADRAASIYQRLKDRAHEAKAWDQIAQNYILQGRFDNAVRAASKAVHLLENSDHEGWLAEALTTQGVALARAGVGDAIRSLTSAAEIGERTGNKFQTDLAYAEMWRIIKEGKALVDLLRPIERILISRALEEHGGSLTLAADSLGLRHQSLDWKIKNYFPELMSKRKTPVKRRKSIIRPRSG